MPPTKGRGAQVVLTGEAQAAARGAVTDDVIGNGFARVAATPVDNQGTPSPAEEGISLNPLVAAPFPLAENDMDAAAKGVPVGGFYRSIAGVQQRQA